MTSKEKILSEIRKDSIKASFDMPETEDVRAAVYDDKVGQFMETVAFVGGKAVLMGEGEDINSLIASLYPEAKTIASSLSGIAATVNPDEVEQAQDLNGTDLGVLKGEIAVAENGCIWVPQTMKERAVMFISECLVIIVDKDSIVDNMHQAYSRIEMTDYGYGCFISGPSKTADIAQALVMGAQAARGVTVVIK